ncbi:MAG: glycoside hydrolase family 47 protein [Bacteroidales bacterium]|nr:glycoside hydrolase family 47 protein [Bacteroidales bacterium]
MKDNPRLALVALVALFALAFSIPGQSQKRFSDRQKAAQCKKIKSACRHAWRGYKKYAPGFDALKPISKTGHNWYGISFLMTPLDAYDTFYLLGLNEEAKEAKEMVISGLTFDVDQEVQLFEINIRLLGGLLSSFELSGDKQFMVLAEDLAARLLRAFNSPTGMPYRFVNLKTGKTRDSLSNPAEIGTYLLEFGKMTEYTGDSTYYKTAKKAAFEVFRRRSDNDLVGTTIDVNTGEWQNTESQIGARIDSYYEYLFKAWLLFGDKDCKLAWEIHNRAIKKHLLTEVPSGWYFTRVDMKSGKETNSLYGSLDAFYSGILALAGDTAMAGKIQKGNFFMWTAFNIEPEEFNFRTNRVTNPSYLLRPENIESCFYLYRRTKDQEYLKMGQRMISDILKRCRTKAGFAAIKNVNTYELSDSMESFFLAETLKYAYLLFAPENTLDLRKVVFNTEAHPFRITNYEL